MPEGVVSRIVRNFDRSWRIEGTVLEVLGHHLHSTPEALSANIEPVLRDAVARCLAKEPAERYSSAGDLIKALEDSPLFRRWTRERSAAWWEEHRDAATHDEIEAPSGPSMTMGVARS